LTLQTLRVALGKTQADIARAAEMDQGDVSRSKRVMTRSYRRSGDMP
jgi:transcriptional regulator with XRE-family HTH domain